MCAVDCRNRVSTWGVLPGEANSAHQIVLLFFMEVTLQSLMGIITNAVG